MRWWGESISIGKIKSSREKRVGWQVTWLKVLAYKFYCMTHLTDLEIVDNSQTSWRSMTSNLRGTFGSGKTELLSRWRFAAADTLAKIPAKENTGRAVRFKVTDCKVFFGQKAVKSLSWLLKHDANGWPVLSPASLTSSNPVGSGKFACGSCEECWEASGDEKDKAEAASCLSVPGELWNGEAKSVKILKFELSFRGTTYVRLSCAQIILKRNSV